MTAATISVSRDTAGGRFSLSELPQLGLATVSVIGAILYVLVRFYTLLLIARLIIEMIASFSQQFRPARWFALVSEPIFQVTDPPVKALRRVIPPLRAGGVAIDVSVLVLFFILLILSQVIYAVFF